MVKLLIALGVLSVAIFIGQFIVNNPYSLYIDLDDSVVKMNFWVSLIVSLTLYVLVHWLIRNLYRVLKLPRYIYNLKTKSHLAKIHKKQDSVLENYFHLKTQSLVDSNIELFKESGKLGYALHAAILFFQHKDESLKVRNLKKILEQKVFQHHAQYSKNDDFLILQLAYRLCFLTESSEDIPFVKEDCQLVNFNSDKRAVFNDKIISPALQSDPIFVALQLALYLEFGQLEEAWELVLKRDKDELKLLEREYLVRVFNYYLLQGYQKEEENTHYKKDVLNCYQSLRSKLALPLQIALDKSIIEYFQAFNRSKELNTLVTQLSKDPQNWQPSLFDAYCFLTEEDDMKIHKVLEHVISLKQKHESYPYINYTIARLSEQAKIVNKAVEYYRLYLNTEQDFDAFNRYQNLLQSLSSNKSP